MEKLITFGQLLQIKREALGLTLTEATAKSKVSSLGDLEKDKAKASKKSTTKLIAFYKLSSSEIASCIEPIKAHPSIKTNRITKIAREIEEIIDEVNAIKISGSLATSLQSKSNELLKTVRDSLKDLAILDHIL